MKFLLFYILKIFVCLLWSFNAVAASLTTPNIILPRADSVINPANPVLLDWSDVATATSYRVQVTKESINFTDDSCSNCLKNQVISTSKLDVSGLDSGKYKWRVRAGNSTTNSGSDWANGAFSIRLPSPQLSYPVNTTINTLTPTFTWNIVPQATTYRIQISENNLIQTDDTEGFVCSDCIINEGSISTNSYTVSSGKLSNNKTYYWRVRAGTNLEKSDPTAVPTSFFSGTKQFSIQILADTQASPTISINSPTSADVFAINQNTIDLAGQATNTAVIHWFTSNNQTGTATGTTDWQINGISLADGNNLVTVTAENDSGANATDTITITKSVVPPIVTTNSEPSFISGAVSSQSVAQKGSLQFKSVWKDAENNPIVGVKVRYRRDGGVLGIDYPWKEESEKFLDYVHNSNPPVFEKTVQIDETEGTYEFEFQASDVEQLGGTTLHTTAWQGLGQFSVVEVTNNQPPILELISKPKVVKHCQPFSLTFRATDPNKNLREVQIDWSGKGTKVTGHLIGDGQIITVTSPVDNGASCISELTNKPSETYLTWTATAYDTLGAKSVMKKAGLHVDRIPVGKGSGSSGGTCPKPNAPNSCNLAQGEISPVFKGDPVNVVTGSQVINLTLLKVDGLLPLSFSLAYDSAILDSSGVVGKAWSSNLSGTRLEQTPENDIIIHWSESQYNTFLLQGDGSYTSGDQRTHFDSLVKNVDGSFTLTRQSKAIYSFSAAGQLQSISNPQAQRLTFEYDATGKVSKVIEPVSKVFLSYQYNTAGLLESVSDSLGRQVSFEYNAAGLLEKITDAAKQTVTYSYDSVGRILKAVNSDNNVLFVNVYDADGRVLSQDDSNPNNQLLRFAYSQDVTGNYVTTLTQRDGTGRVYTYSPAYELLSLQDELNQINQIRYDEFTGLPLEIINPKGAKTQLIYDDNGNLISGVNAKGVATQISYDTSNHPVAIVDALNNKETFAYNDKQLLISATDAANQTTTLTYNSDNQLSTVTSPKGAILQLEYQNGSVSKVTDAEGQVQSITRDAAGRVIQVTDAEGHSTELVLDAVNRLVSMKDALGRTVVTLTYNARDKVTSVQDAKGNVTRFEYDVNGNRVKVINALGQSSRFEYDAEDRLIKVIDAANHTSQLVRDATGRVIKTIDPLGNVNEVQYDAAGNAVKQVDALGQAVISLSYDILDNVTQATDALGNAASVEYDQLDRVIKSMNPLQQVTQYQYDTLSRLQSSLDALGGQSSRTFDADGALASFKDPNQHETRFTLDKSGRLVEQTTTTGGKVSYRYNARDLLVEVKNARGQTRSVEYDAVGRVTQWTDEVSTRSYQYDANDNVLSVNDSVAGKVTFAYDALDRVVSYTDAQGNKLGYLYDVVGNLAVLTYPDGKQVKYAYDARGALESVTDWANRVTRYTYDANGRLVKEVRPNQTILTKRYDAAGQLVEAQDVDGAGQSVVSVTYQYNAAGNIVAETLLPEPDMSKVQPMTLSYGAGNSIAQVNGQATTLDADGNLLQAPLDGVMTNFVFNARNQLTAAAGLTYGYDALGYRDTVTEKGKVTRYVLNPVPALHQALVRIAPDGQKTFYVYGMGLLGEETGGKYLSYHFDYRGSTVALTASDGQVVSRFGYEPYGGLLSHDASVASVTPFLFNGQYGVVTDTNGLYQMRARFYHPELRRFVNQDPVFLGSVAESQSLNRFAFVTGEPVSLVDPWGLEGVGHHWVPKEVFRELPKGSEAYKLFDNAYTGDIFDKPHGWDKLHKRYNEAVIDMFHSLKEKPTTARQAQEFLQKIAISKDPRITGYLKFLEKSSGLKLVQNGSLLVSRKSKYMSVLGKTWNGGFKVVGKGVKFVGGKVVPVITVVTFSNDTYAEGLGVAVDNQLLNVPSTIKSIINSSSPQTVYTLSVGKGSGAFIGVSTDENGSMEVIGNVPFSETYDAENNTFRITPNF